MNSFGDSSEGKPKSPDEDLRDEVRKRIEYEKGICPSDEEVTAELARLGLCVSTEMTQFHSLLSEEEQGELDNFFDTQLSRQIEALDPAFCKYFLSSEVDIVLKQVNCLESISGNYSYRFSHNGNNWNVAEAFWDDHEFPHGAGGRAKLVITSEKNPYAYTTLNLYPIESLEKRLIEAVKRATLEWESQESNAHRLSSYDLPRDERIFHVSLLPRQLDLAIAVMKDEADYFSKLLRSKGYDIYSSNSLQTESPKSTIYEQIKEAREIGSSRIILNLYAHGDRAGIYYGSSILSPEDLLQIVSDSPDMDFLILGFSCNGGNMADKFAKAGLSNVTFGLSSKPYNITNTLVTPDKFPEGGTYFSVFLMEGIRKMGPGVKVHLEDGFVLPLETIGDAMRYSDLRSREYGAFDNPEFILPGGIYISKYEKPDADNHVQAA